MNIHRVETEGGKMKKIQDRDNTLLWLMKPEDSSSWDAERMEACPCEQNRKVLFSSTAKFLVWYGAALSMGILLARLH